MSSTMSGFSFIIPLSIPSEYESVIDYIANQSIEHCVQMYTSDMNLNLQYPYDEENDRVNVFNWEDFNEFHLKAFAKVEKEFFKRIIGNETQIKEYENKLNEKINKEFEIFRKSNSEALYEYNMGLAEKLWNDNVKV